MDKELVEQYQRLSRLQKRELQGMLNEFNLYIGQPAILHCVMRHHKITLTQLVKETSTSKESLSVSIKRLEKAGFIVRVADLDDRRIQWISLTQKGEEMTHLCHQNYMKTSAQMFRLLDENEKIQLKGLFEKMIIGLEGEKNGIL